MCETQPRPKGEGSPLDELPNPFKGEERAWQSERVLKELGTAKPECKHEWEVTGGHAEDTEDHLTMIFLTDYKCKLCGKTTDSIDHVHDH